MFYCYILIIFRVADYVCNDDSAGQSPFRDFPPGLLSHIVTKELSPKTLQISNQLSSLLSLKFAAKVRQSNIPVKSIFDTVS
jgi:hypothetical protein